MCGTSSIQRTASNAEEGRERRDVRARMRRQIRAVGYKSADPPKKMRRRISAEHPTIPELTDNSSRTSQDKAIRNVMKHEQTTINEETFHIISSAGDGKAKCHARQWIVPNSAPAMAEEQNIVSSFVASL